MKPRIRRFNGEWACSAPGDQGFWLGLTIGSAYRSWLCGIGSS